MCLGFSHLKNLLIWGSISFFIEDTLWTGVPGNYTDKNTPEVLAEVRKLVDDKKYPEATTAAEKLSGIPSEVCNILQIDITLFLQFMRNYDIY